MDDDSTQDIALTPPEMLNEARERLSSALDLLGRYQEALLPDSSLQGAAKQMGLVPKKGRVPP